MDPDFIATIRRLSTGLRPSERRVADYVLRGPEIVVTATTAEAARAAGVSEPTVIRFCRAVGCEGFQAFKLRLAQDLATGARPLPEDIEPDDDVGTIAQKVLNREIAALTRARNRLDPRQLEAATAILSRAARIEFYGFGASGAVAVDAQNKFFRLGLPVVAHTDYRVQAMAAAVLGPDAAIVAISHTGRTRELLNSVRIALRNGVPVVAVTGTGSPLAQCASATIAVDVPEDTSLRTPMSSRLVHLAVLDALQVAVALRRGPPALTALARSKDTLNVLSGIE